MAAFISMYVVTVSHIISHEPHDSQTDIRKDNKEMASNAWISLGELVATRMGPHKATLSFPRFVLWQRPTYLLYTYFGKKEHIQFFFLYFNKFSWSSTNFNLFEYT